MFLEKFKVKDRLLANDSKKEMYGDIRSNIRYFVHT